MIENFNSASEYARRLFNIENEELLSIKKEALEEGVPIITDEVLNFMIFLAKNHNAKNILEIGTAVGYSGIFLANICRENEGKLTTIEIDEKRFFKAKENFLKAKVENYVDIILGDALLVMEDLKKKYDFIFLDASKSKYESFFEKAIKLLNKDGYIFIDNLMFRSYVSEENVPKRYKTIKNNLDKFIKKLNKNYNFILLPFGDGVGLVKNR